MDGRSSSTPVTCKGSRSLREAVQVDDLSPNAPCRHCTCTTPSLPPALHARRAPSVLRRSLPSFFASPSPPPPFLRRCPPHTITARVRSHGSRYLAAALLCPAPGLSPHQPHQPYPHHHGRDVCACSNAQGTATQRCLVLLPRPLTAPYASSILPIHPPPPPSSTAGVHTRAPMPRGNATQQSCSRSVPCLPSPRSSSCHHRQGYVPRPFPLLRRPLHAITRRVHP